MKQNRNTITKPNLFLLIAGLVLACYSSFCQNGVGIGTVSPDASAVLHVQPPADNKGLLIPRLTLAQRNGITSPAEGLLVYVIDPAPPSVPSIEGFYFSSGGTWYPLSGWVKSVNSSNVSLEGNASINGALSVSGGITNSGSFSTNALASSGNVSAVSLDVSGFSTNALVPFGVIVMWSGTVASIPGGWRICDGTGGTPDLRGRFIIGGGGGYAIGTTGGSESATLNSDQLPPHRHAINDNHSSPNINTTGLTVITDSYYGGSSTSITRPNDTGNSPIDIRPPYYALAYIMKL